MSRPVLDGNPSAAYALLEPKILANTASKIPGMEGLAYSDVLTMVGDRGVAVADRLRRVTAYVGDASLTDELLGEVTALRLCATGQETEIQDADRQGVYAKSDTRQLRHATSGHNLDYYLRGGVEVIFSPEDREAANRHCALDTRDVPLMEKLKAQRLFTINGFQDSRVMYAVHDMIDHAWLFNQMRETGIMDRYADFLGSIDMGQDAYLYSRQAELLASVGFGSRRWEVAKQQNEQLILTPEDLKTILTSRDDDRTTGTARLLDAMNPEQCQQAVFMIENMAIQLTDERRRWGAVKQHVEGELKPMALLDPLHVALMVETLNMLQRSRQYGGIQLQATVEVEKVLIEALTDKGDSGIINIPIPRGDVRPSGLEIASADHMAWLRQHPSVSTSYNKIG